jgi:hypothetical protein
MAAMTWFWRLVCEPECSEACQANCPGCRALAPEWEGQGHVLPATGPVVRFRWRKVPELWRCWSKSASARVIARVVPARLRQGRIQATPAAASCGGASCGCEPVDAHSLPAKEGVGQHVSVQAVIDGARPRSVMVEEVRNS